MVLRNLLMFVKRIVYWTLNPALEYRNSPSSGCE